MLMQCGYAAHWSNAPEIRAPWIATLDGSWRVRGVFCEPLRTRFLEQQFQAWSFVHIIIPGAQPRNYDAERESPTAPVCNLSILPRDQLPVSDVFPSAGGKRPAHRQLLHRGDEIYCEQKDTLFLFYSCISLCT